MSGVDTGVGRLVVRSVWNADLIWVWLRFDGAVAGTIFVFGGSWSEVRTRSRAGNTTIIL